MPTSITYGPLTDAYKGTLFTIKQREVTLPNGKKKIYEYCTRPTSVSVLALNDKNELLMIREVRNGKLVWFLPGGRMDEGETPKKAIVREMREESGFKPKKIKLLYKKSHQSTLLWDIYIFTAKDLVHDPLPHDEGEIIEPIFVPLKKAVQMAKDGTVENEYISYNIIRFAEMLKKGEINWE